MRKKMFLHFCEADVVYIIKPIDARLAPLSNSPKTRWRPRRPSNVFFCSSFKHVGFVLAVLKWSYLLGN